MFRRAKIRVVTFDASSLKSNLSRIHELMDRAAARAGRRADEITLVGVSKTFPAEAIRDAYALDLRHFGENRVQEWDLKREAAGHLDATVHLIGHLQSNKARRAAQIFDMVDSVDSIALARKLDAAFGEAAKSSAARLPVLIEVRLAAEESKSGVTQADLPALAAAIRELSHLELRGLMAIPPFLESPEDVRPHFRRLREIRDALRDSLGSGAADSLRELSMGMSHDFEVAIEEGATQIRIGSALFGSRPAL